MSAQESKSSIGRAPATNYSSIILTTVISTASPANLVLVIRRQLESSFAGPLSLPCCCSKVHQNSLYSFESTSPLSPQYRISFSAPRKHARGGSVEPLVHSIPSHLCRENLSKELEGLDASTGKTCSFLQLLALIDLELCSSR